MARKRKQQLIKKLLIIGAALAVAQLVFVLIYMQDSETRPIAEEIAEKVKAYPGISPQRRELLRVQLSVNDYRDKKGQYPKSLEELIGVYFESVPKDPATGKPFSYKLVNNKPQIGERAGVAMTTEDIPREAGEIGKPSAAEQEVLIASLDEGAKSVEFVYDPTNKRDPFRPYDQTAAYNVDCQEHPLACYDTGQLRLTAVLGDGDSATATVENAAGKGFIVRKGTRIGRYGGEVIEIQRDQIKILETITDFTGAETNRVVPMGLRTKDQDAALKSGVKVK